MTPEQRAEVEVRAEKAIRRGELSAALGLLQSLSEAFPGDAALRGRIDDLRASVLPEELRQVRRPGTGPGGAGEATPALDHAAEGEQRFQQGDYVGAATAYRQALREKPHNDLYRERLVELVQLAQRLPAPPTPSLESAPSPTLERLALGGPAPAFAGRPAAAVPGSVDGVQDPVTLLESLLVRIAERRRSPAPS